MPDIDCVPDPQCPTLDDNGPRSTDFRRRRFVISNGLARSSQNINPTEAIQEELVVNINFDNCAEKHIEKGIITCKTQRYPRNSASLPSFQMSTALIPFLALAAKYAG